MTTATLKAAFLSLLFLCPTTAAQTGSAQVFAVYPLTDVLAIADAPQEHATVLVRSGETYTASVNLIQLNFTLGQLRISSLASGDGGWINLPNSMGDKRSSIVQPVILSTEWDSGNPHVHHKVTTNCDTYQDLRACAAVHQRAVAAMQAIYPPS